MFELIEGLKLQVRVLEQNAEVMKEMFPERKASQQQLLGAAEMTKDWVANIEEIHGEMV